jgi:hypothetical protein
MFRQSTVTEFLVTEGNSAAVIYGDFREQTAQHEMASSHIAQKEEAEALRRQSKGNCPVG